MTNPGVSILPKGTDFARALIALAISQNNPSHAKEFAIHKWGPASRAVVLLHKMALTSLDPASGPLVADESATTEFFELVGKASVLGRITGWRRMPLRRRVVTGGGATATWTGEGAQKLVSAMGFLALTLEARKVTGLIVATLETLRDSDLDVEAMVRNDLTRAISEAIDLALLDPANAGDATTPTSLTSGALVVAGGSPSSVQADFQEMIDAFDGDLSTAHLIMAPETAVSIAGAANPDVGARGGAIAGIPVIVSRSSPPGQIVLLDPASVALGEGPAEIRTITQGDILLTELGSTMTVGGSDQQSPSRAPVGSAQLINLWQSNSAALLTGRLINWMPVRPNAVVMVQGAAY